MKLEKIYRLRDRNGNAQGPARQGACQALSDAREEYEGLKGDEKRFFDKERLENPFADTRILYGDPGIEVKNVMVGVDVEAPELLLADRLREKGAKLDLCIGHHPEGRALAALSEVMGVQADAWAAFGVPVNVGDALISERMSEIKAGAHAAEPPEADRYRKTPGHTVHMRPYARRQPGDRPPDATVFKRTKPRLVGDVVDLC